MFSQRLWNFAKESMTRQRDAGDKRSFYEKCKNAFGLYRRAKSQIYDGRVNTDADYYTIIDRGRSVCRAFRRF